MNVSIQYADVALGQLKKLDVVIAKRIVKKITVNASQDDPLSRAKALRGTLSGKYRYRIGDYRAIFIIDESGVITLLTILNIKHRRDVYR